MSMENVKPGQRQAGPDADYEQPDHPGRVRVQKINQHNSPSAQIGSTGPWRRPRPGTLPVHIGQRDLSFSRWRQTLRLAGLSEARIRRCLESCFRLIVPCE